MVYELMQSLLNELVANVTMAGGVTLYDCFKRLLRRKTQDKSTSELRELLQGFGTLSHRQIGRLVAQAARKQPGKLSREQQEELVNLMHSLANGAQFVTSQGKPVSTYLRSERLLEQLLSDIQPARRRGEAVGAGFGKWKLEHFLGRGSFGEVWTARYGSAEWVRAFKFFTHPESREWVEREEQNLIRLKEALPQDHPNIVRLHNISIAGQQYPFFEFDYIRGGSLEQWILEDADERPAVDKARVIHAITEGLAAAHEQQIFHRDMKPANVVLTDGPDPIPMLTDFGLATGPLERPGLASASSNSSAGLLAGTSMYLPPEAQQPFAAVDPARQDVFALGVMWYQLCVERLERPPYNFAPRLAAHDVDSRSIDLIARCLAHPDERFADAVEFRQHLADRLPPAWHVPDGLLNVQHLVREALAAATPV